MEGDETADLRESDDGQGIHLVVRRIVPSEDVPSLGPADSSKSPSEGAKAKGKGKENPSESPDKGSDEADPNVGAFTVYDDEEYYR